ncbi:MAG: hypothetical protein JST11_20530 [Acidobacteria bacterium]|nr:hypothetical protein [Acidobacteriota bacterium]
MRSVFAVLISAAALAAAPQTKPAASPAPAPSAARSASRLEIPSGAVEREPGRFFYTDRDGKTWIYARTPFGVSRTEDRGAAPAAAKKGGDPLANTKITQFGDTVTFERSSPFGTYHWQKKTADLDEQERAALNRSRAAAAAPAAKDADHTAKQER